MRPTLESETKMTTSPRVGDVRVADGADYERDGFVIEQFGYWNMGTGAGEPSWAIPAWEEMSLGHLAGPFATREAAETAANEEV